MIKTRTADNLIDYGNANLIELLYTTPARVAKWFNEKNVAISINECRKLMLNNKI